jgi:RNA polymerase sigma-70 factor (ECF subfamily)
MAIPVHESWRVVAAACPASHPFAAYSRPGSEGPWAAHSLQVLSLEQDAISGVTLFAKPTGPQLFAAFGLPLTLPDTAGGEVSTAPHHF